MTEPNPPTPDHLPDHVLEELLDAFSEESTPDYNFDDPSIDRLLGITDEHQFDDDEIDDHLIDVDADDIEDAIISVPSQPAAAAPANDGPRKIIVIADLDEHGGGGEPPVARSRSERIDPRIRARRISVRRAESRRRLIWVGIGVVVILLAVAAVAVVASPIFDVRTVTVQGATYTDREVLESIIDSLEGEPVLLVDTEAIENQLEAVPWVENARVRTDFPHGVFIDIRERRPVASFRGSDERFRVIDVQGRVLDVIDGQPIDYLLIDGVHPNTARGQFAGAAYASAAELVQALPAEIRAISASVGVDPATGTLTLFLVGDGVAEGEGSVLAARLGDSIDLDKKLARLLSQVRDGVDGICGLDVSTAVAGVVPC